MKKSQVKATNKYIAKAYDRINLFVKKGQKEIIKAHAAGVGDGSVNAFINRAIDETMQRDRKEKSNENAGNRSADE